MNNFETNSPMDIMNTRCSQLVIAETMLHPNRFPVPAITGVLPFRPCDRPVVWIRAYPPSRQPSKSRPQHALRVPECSGIVAEATGALPVDPAQRLCG